MGVDRGKKTFRFQSGISQSMPQMAEYPLNGNMIPRTFIRFHDCYHVIPCVHLFSRLRSPLAFSVICRSTAPTFPHAVKLRNQNLKGENQEPPQKQTRCTFNMLDPKPAALNPKRNPQPYIHLYMAPLKGSQRAPYTSKELSGRPALDGLPALAGRLAFGAAGVLGLRGLRGVWF